MPMYRTKYLYNNQWDVVHKGGSNLGNRWFEYTIIKEKTINWVSIYTSLISTVYWIVKKFMDTMMMQKDLFLSR
jgi:hypothetical protein